MFKEKFKVGDLIEPTPEAREKFTFNKNLIFPWKVIEYNHPPSLWLERYSKKGKPRRELWHDSFFQLSDAKNPSKGASE